MNRRRWRQLVVCVCIAGATTLHTAAASGAPLAPAALPAPLGSEVEPNQSPAEATFLQGDMRVRASLGVPGDVDYYGFEGHAGERVFAATITAATLGAADARTRLTLYQSDGVTPIEVDENGGSLFKFGSSIAGATLPPEPPVGLYYLRVEDVRGAAAPAAPYDLYLAHRSGTAAAEVEPNDEFNEANPLANGEVTGTHEPDLHHKDWFAVNLQAGDTAFLSLDLDPERDGGSFDGQLGLGLAGDTDNSILTVDDPQMGETPDATPSESLAMTVSKGGTYYGYVDIDPKKLDTGGPQATYDLAVSVFPVSQPVCRTYSSSLTSAFLDGGTTTFPIQVDDVAQVRRAAIRLNLGESSMSDLDVFLRSPSGLELPLFTDIGWSPGEDLSKKHTHLEAVFDDFAAVPPLFLPVRPLGMQGDVPLAGFAGQQAQGTWSLVVRDDTANESAGSLAKAELVLCPQPGSEPGPAAPGGGGPGAQPPQARTAQPPVLSGFTVAPSQFRAAKAGPMVLAKRPKAGGALVSYQSSEAAQTNLILYELEEGRKVGGKCVRRTASNSTRKPCVRPVKVISFGRNDAAGRNQFGFTGRVGARKLPPGEYKLQARAYATSGLTSAPVGATFTVLPPAPRK